MFVYSFECEALARINNHHTDGCWKATGDPNAGAALTAALAKPPKLAEAEPNMDAADVAVCCAAADPTADDPPKIDVLPVALAPPNMLPVVQIER